jgi:hypothetical protein
MVFKTESGSAYEVDAEGKRIRRLHGVLDPTSRQGTDGTWKTYEDLTDIEVGRPVLIMWFGSDATVTSYVTEILTPANMN